MRELVQDALVVYRQEADSLLTIVAPVAVLGPLLVIVSATGLTGALIALPVFALLYLATYAASVRAGARVLRSLSPDPGRTYLEVLRSAPSVLLAAAAPAALMLAVVGGAVFLSYEGFGLAGVGLGLVGLAAFVHWLSRHAYDQALVFTHELPATEALHVGPQLVEANREWTMQLLAVIGLPVAVAGLGSAVLGLWVSPVLGGGVFNVALALWLPLAATCLTFGCERLVEEAAGAQVAFQTAS